MDKSEVDFIIDNLTIYDREILCELAKEKNLKIVTSYGEGGRYASISEWGATNSSKNQLWRAEKDDAPKYVLAVKVLVECGLLINLGNSKYCLSVAGRSISKLVDAIPF